MRARPLLLAVCVISCLAVACGDDDDSSPGGKGGAAGQAGAAGKAGGGGSPTNGGTESKGGQSKGGEANPVGEAGEPGAAGMMNQGGLGGAGGEATPSFDEFVHDLIENHTLETNQPAPTDQQFSEPQDDHGHYLVPGSAFDDVF